MTVSQEHKAQARLEAMGWTRHRGLIGSYWTHATLGEKCFSGSVEDLLMWLA